jgi:integrase
MIRVSSLKFIISATILCIRPWEGLIMNAKRKTRHINKLQPNIMKLGAGMYGDGGGLWLRKTGKDSGSWVYRYQIDKNAHELGLGGINTVSLSEARAAALELRKLHKTTKERVDPLAKKRADAAKRKIEEAAAVTFRDCAAEYIAHRRAGWSNAKHARQWSQTLEDYAYPTLGDMPVAAIDLEAVKQVLLQPVDGKPFWSARPETASRLRNRVERVLDAAAASGKRDGSNPARWKTLEAMGFVSRKKAEKGQERHHEALPYNELPRLMATLKGREDISARTLEFVVLTACRIGEARMATWDEIDLENKLWTVPAHKIKARQEHEIPLSARAVEILEAVKGEGHLVFPGRGGAPVSNKSVLNMLNSIASGTVHGMRSSFRNWVAEATQHPREVAEAALAHQIASSKTEQAYLRTKLLTRRRALMDDWCKFCEGETGTICEFTRKRMG